MTPIPHHHPPCSLLMRYAAGTISEAMRLMVASHAALCPRCRKLLHSCDAEAGLALELLQPEPMDISCLDNLLRKIDEHGPPLCIDVTLPPPRKIDSRIPEPLQVLTGLYGEKIEWRDGAGSNAVMRDYALTLVELHAGQNYSTPRNALLMVLDGEFASFHRGDVIMRHISFTAPRNLLLLLGTPKKNERENWWEKILGWFRK